VDFCPSLQFALAHYFENSRSSEASFQNDQMSLTWGYQGLPEAQGAWQEADAAAAGTQSETSATHLTGPYTHQRCFTAFKPVQHEDTQLSSELLQ